MGNLSKRISSSAPSLSSSLRDDFFYPLEQQFDRFWTDFWGNDVMDGLKASTGYPKLDITTGEGKFTITAAVPGVEQDNVSVEVLPDGIVRISGEMAKEYKSEKADYYVRELHKSRFCREVRLPDGVTGDPEAELKSGILSLTWKYDEPVRIKPKLIEIKKK
jgi:HSP20 family molecular chaperone IbpA